MTPLQTPDRPEEAADRYRSPARGLAEEGTSPQVRSIQSLHGFVVVPAALWDKEQGVCHDSKHRIGREGRQSPTRHPLGWSVPVTMRLRRLRKRGNSSRQCRYLSEKDWFLSPLNQVHHKVWWTCRESVLSNQFLILGFRTKGVAHGSLFPKT